MIEADKPEVELAYWLDFRFAGIYMMISFGKLSINQENLQREFKQQS